MRNKTRNVLFDEYEESEADSGRGSIMVREGSEGIKRKRKEDEGGPEDH